MKVELTSNGEKLNDVAVTPFHPPPIFAGGVLNMFVKLDDKTDGKTDERPGKASILSMIGGIFFKSKSSEKEQKSDPPNPVTTSPVLAKTDDVIHDVTNDNRKVEAKLSGYFGKTAWSQTV